MQSRKSAYLAQMMVHPPHPVWRVQAGLADYTQTLAAMEAHVDGMARGEAGEEIWLVEHPPVITAGTSAAPGELLAADQFPVVAIGRGGKFTYHGPGQRVVYPMLDLARRGRDVRRYVSALELWAIEALAQIGVVAGTNPAGTGIWVRQGAEIAKVGAIGVRVRRWISFHGLALNVATDLNHYAAIIPCGLADYRVARLIDLQPELSMEMLDKALLNALPDMLHHLAGPEACAIKTLEAARDCS